MTSTKFFDAFSLVVTRGHSCVLLDTTHVYRLFYLAVGKLADIPFRDVNFLRYFGCSNICFLEFLISLANFRLIWRIVAPTRRKIDGFVWFACGVR